MKQNFMAVYGFGAQYKELVCLDASDFPMAGYINGFATVS
jgi:hypothetical protein